MTRDDVQVVKTEAVFREVNERIAESAEQFEAGDASFVCECADPSCTERVDAQLSDYETVRAEGASFLTVPGHELPDRESVLERRSRFQVVRKRGSLGMLARRLNPRASAA